MSCIMKLHDNYADMVKHIFVDKTQIQYDIKKDYEWKPLLYMYLFGIYILSLKYMCMYIVTCFAVKNFLDHRSESDNL